MSRAITLALLFVLAACDSKPEHDPAWWDETGAMIGDINRQWCDDPRGTQADGSCAE